MRTAFIGINIPDFIIMLKWIKKGNKSSSDLHRELNISYKHLHELKHTFKKLEWITTYKDDKRDVMVLTEEGNKVYEIINPLLEYMELDYEAIRTNIEYSKIKKHTDINIDNLKKEIEEYDIKN
jgi:predicted transcriptional regulator